MELCSLPDSCDNVRLIETHISWIILAQHYAFKIKRPVRYAFLDFSLPEQRKYFCEQEIKLNSRLAPHMYIKVIPVTEAMLGGNKNGEKIIDYAVQMKRMDNRLELAEQLKNGSVNQHQIDKIARKIAEFHKKTRMIKNAFDTTEFQRNYAELLDEKDFISINLGDKWYEKINSCIKKSNSFLNSRRAYLNERITRGLRKDCHGDLSSHNIFLYDNPVIFDCIEFNEDFRYIDVFNEIAFLCADLDFYNRADLSEYFYVKYLEEMGLEDDTEGRNLFNYYKSYRANINAKVTMINREKSDEDRNNPDILKEIKRYLKLMCNYLEAVERISSN